MYQLEDNPYINDVANDVNRVMNQNGELQCEILYADPNQMHASSLDPDGDRNTDIVQMSG